MQLSWQWIKDMFAPHGILERLITDMPFNRLTLTSSPHYQKSNGLVERNVQNVKRCLEKLMSLSSTRFTGVPHLPYQGHGRIPSRITLSRKLRTRLPTFKSLLEPQVRATSQVRHHFCCRANSVRKHSMMIVGPDHFPHCAKANQWEWGVGGNVNSRWLSSSTRHPIST